MHSKGGYFAGRRLYVARIKSSMVILIIAEYFAKKPSQYALAFGFPAGETGTLKPAAGQITG